MRHDTCGGSSNSSAGDAAAHNLASAFSKKMLASSIVQEGDGAAP